MKTIPLTHGKVALVDDADYAGVACFRWHAHANRNTWYAERKTLDGGRKTAVSMHRQLMGLTDPKTQVDHIDGDGLNNMRVNMRVASNAQNSRNQRNRCDNTTGYRGVAKCGRKWRARIMLNGKKTHAGLCGTAREAAVAYDSAAVRLFGEFARLNFPEANAPISRF